MKNKKNFFSVIIPTYNRPKTLSKSINSVLNQNFKNFEIIVVDDCSEDSTFSLVERYSQKAQFRIELLSLKHKPQNQQNKKSGIAYAIDNANGDWVICTDADCVMSSNWVKSISAFSDNSGISLIR